MPDLLPSSGDLLLTRARTWASPDAPLANPGVVLVRDGVVRQVGGDVPADVDLPRVDVGGRVVTAGFTNCHVHLTEGVWAGARTAPAAQLQEALDDMLLRRGFTTALDLGSDPRHTSAVVQRIASGDLRGPEILTAGPPNLPTRGVPFYLRDSLPWYARLALPSPASAAAVRRAVALRHRRGAALTKLFTGSPVERDRVRTMDPDVARAAVEESHRLGMLVLAHPTDRGGTQVAVRAGVDALAHVPSAPDGTGDLLREAAERGIRLVPTLHMFAATVTPADSFMGPIRDALRTFLAAGGRVLFGTDVGYLTDRDIRPELEAMAACGMTTRDVLRALTTEPAAFLRRDDAGEVRPGARGDLTVLSHTHGDLDPGDLADVDLVVRAGRVVHGSVPVV
ncbi:amidohydrolase family protein [Cellulomonas phragmiteti]|uniref:Xaa-Pro dipeptidase n=1 Tax=Cellulomonas phragmiteti TaxID=478780 RepID=A0ABQ4DN12_9CELL|nr:amidohydrolase family protein [Cellulomonas phragmiteti]GIG40742.1 Xaa-Pro dipeptidase [Cellulomonas phragmiteti]